MTGINYGSTDTKQIYYGSTAIKEVYYGSKKIRPRPWRYTPTSNTMLYLPFESDYSDHSGKGRTNEFKYGTYSLSKYNGVDALYLNYGCLRYTNPNVTNVNYTFSCWSALTSRNSTWEIITWITKSTSSGTDWNNSSNIGVNNSGYYWCSRANNDTSSGVSYKTGWHLITVTTNSSSTKMYLDGTLILNYSASVTTQTMNIVDVGGRHDVYTSQGWRGYLTEFLIENRVRSASEIQNYYNDTKSNFGL